MSFIADIVNRQYVYAVINGERAYQDERWGVPAPDQYKSVGDFLVYMDRYLSRAKEEYTTKDGNESALHMIRKVAALAVACMEYNGAPPRDSHGPRELED
jgi:hypothetical protein